MKRAIVVVKGKVQRVAYRDFVEDIAIDLGLTGFVENIKPYDVKIVCEGEEQKIKEFLEKIKHPPEPAVFRDMEVNFEEPKGEFKYFEIKRGDPAEEQGERFDVAGKVLYEVRDLQKETLGLQKETLGLQKETLGLQKETLNSVNGMKTDLTESVNSMKTEVIDRFGSIGEDMKKILIEFQKDRKENREFMERMIKSMEDLARSTLDKK